MIIFPSTYLKERNEHIETPAPQLLCVVATQLRNSQAAQLERRSWQHTAMVSHLLCQSCFAAISQPSCLQQMPVTSHPSAHRFTLPPPAPEPKARNSDTLHGLAESEAPSSCSCVRAAPFLGGTQRVSMICTYLAPCLNLGKAEAAGFEMCLWF